MIFILRLLFWPLLLISIWFIAAVFHWPIWLFVWNWFIEDLSVIAIGEKILVIITVFYLVKYAVYWSRFGYAMWAAKYMVSMKVSRLRA